MSLKKTAVATLLATSGLFVSATATAQARGGNADLGFYVGASVGQSSADCGGGVGSCDDKDTAYRFFGGYKFHPNIAVEGGYSPLGEVTATGAGVNAKFESNAWDIVAVGMWPLGNNFSIFGKLGFYNAEVKLSSNVGASGKKTSSDLTYGIGGQYDLNRNLGFRVEWQRYSGVKGPD